VESLLNHPAVQGGVLPFAAGLIVAGVLHRLRLGGLAVVAAFATAVYFVDGFAFAPLTATRKIVLLGLAAPLVGLLADFAFKPTRIGALVLGLAGAACAVWAIWSVVSQKTAAEAFLLAGSAALALAFMVGFGQLLLAEQPVRAGAAALAAGVGVGVAAIIAGSAKFGMYGIATGAGAGAFLLLQMITGRKTEAGATFTLPAMLIAGLLAVGTMVLAKLPWYALLVLALTPAAARLPVPDKAPLWLQAVLLSLYAFIVAAVACFLSWPSANEPLG